MPGEHEEIKRLLEENIKVAKENHVLLEKMHRMHVYSFWMKGLWFGIIVGIPFIAYYFILDPYLQAFGVNAGQFGELLKNASHFFGSDSVTEVMKH